MLKQIRHKAPFIMLGYCIILTIFSHYSIYTPIYPYLGDVFGYSIFTNLFMLSVYMNKKYCTATKIAVSSLLLLNISNMAYTYFEINGFMYDISIMFLTVIILIIYKIYS